MIANSRGYLKRLTILPAALTIPAGRRALAAVRALAMGTGLLLCALVLTPIRAQGQTTPFDLAAALATAQPGATITVPAGVHLGPVQIDRPLTLQGEPGATIDGGGQGDVITIAAPDVTVRGLIIRNSGLSLDREHAGVTVLAPRAILAQNRLEDVLFGIYLKNAPGSKLLDNVVLSKQVDIARRGDGIKIWYSAGCTVAGNRVSGSRDVIVWYSPQCVVRNNLVENSRYGIHYMQSDNQVLEHNILRHNSVGVYVMYGHDIILRNNFFYGNRGPSGFGIGLKEADNVTASGNRSVANRVGVYIDNSPPSRDAIVRFERNIFAYNEIGAELLPSVQRNIYTANVFQENEEQVALAGGGDATANQWSVANQGNYWSDYAGFDADGDQVGDLPYQAQSLFENLTSNHPELRLFQQSPAATALDLAARAFPIFQPQPKFTDEFPLMAPPNVSAAPGLPPPPLRANLAVAITMIALALLILWRVRWRLTN